MIIKKLICRKSPLYLPFDKGRFRLSMGMVSLSLDKWLEPDDYYFKELLEKETLLTHRKTDVFQSMPGSQLAQQEVLDLVIAHMSTLHSDLVRVDGKRIFIDGIRRSFLKKDFEEKPLDLAGRIVQEDLCIMAPGSAGYTLSLIHISEPTRRRGIAGCRVGV